MAAGDRRSVSKSHKAAELKKHPGRNKDLHKVKGPTENEEPYQRKRKKKTSGF
jgi:hypothetical protein